MTKKMVTHHLLYSLEQCPCSMSLNKIFFCPVSTKLKLRHLKPDDESFTIVLALVDNKKVLVYVSAAEFISIFSLYFVIVLEGSAYLPS